MTPVVFWRALIARFEASPLADDAFARTVAPWAALAMKECVQESICSIWTHFCRAGFRRDNAEGLTRDELRTMIHGLADDPELALGNVSLRVSADESARDAQRRLVAQARELDWNAVRAWTASQESASSGVAALLIFADRVPDPGAAHPLWVEIAGRGSEHQDGLLGIISLVRRELASEPTVGELLDWVVRRFIIGPHEVIAIRSFLRPRSASVGKRPAGFASSCPAAVAMIALTLPMIGAG
jgi:hypothetical protein